jgi:hypothetical protein
MSIHSSRHSFAILFITLVALPIGLTQKAKAYTLWDDNPRAYSSGNCSTGLSDNGDRWYNVRQTLSGSMGWGWAWLTANHAKASDFIELNLGGQDAYAADMTNVAVFDGHGNVNDLAFAYQDSNGYCDAGYWGNTSDSNIQMGMNGGGKAALMILETCCYMMKGSTISIATFGGIQELGFGSLASSDTGMVDDFFGHTNSGTNWYYWLRDMEDKPGWWTGDNTTVVVTRGWDMSDVTNNRTNCKFKGQTCLNNPPYGNGPSIWWQRDWIEHGCGGCAVCN